MLLFFYLRFALRPETHIQRQAALHDCLPRLLGYGDTYIEIVSGENIFYWAVQSSQARIKVSCIGTTSQSNNSQQAPPISGLCLCQNSLERIQILVFSFFSRIFGQDLDAALDLYPPRKIADIL